MPVNQQTLQDLGEERPSMKVMVYDMLKKKKAKAKEMSPTPLSTREILHIGTWNMRKVKKLQAMTELMADQNLADLIVCDYQQEG